MKKVVAVEPYWHCEHLNFKHKAYDAWLACGGKVTKPHYPPKWTHSLIHRLNLPSFPHNNDIARLRFIQPVNFWLDAFPDYITYEIIPIIWDCWAHVRELTGNFFKKYRVKTAVFTSSQTAEIFRNIFPEMNIMTITEGIDTEGYSEGAILKERSIDLLEFGRKNHIQISKMEGICHLCNNEFELLFEKNEDFMNALAKTKIAITLPKSVTDPEYAKGIETLTQRYWECMLSRLVMVGYAPKELTDLIGYNPVVDLDKEHAQEQILDILSHIEEYQSIVDHNRETALNLGSWDIRMKQVMEWLHEIGYEV